MPAPYSVDLRQKVLEAYRCQEGSIRQVAKRFKLSKNTVSELITRFRNTGQVTPKRRKVAGNPAKIDEQRAEYLAELLQSEPDLTLAELCQRFEVHFGELISLSAMDRGLKKHQLTRKKNVLRSQKAYKTRPATPH
jgi:transposase